MNKTLLALAVGTALSSAASAQTVIGITETDSMFQFQANAPGTISMKMAITGLATGQTIVGMDYRPATSQLYVLGYSGTTNIAQLYTLNTSTAALTAVGASFTAQLGNANGSSTGTSVGFDFNPTVDRIRLVSSNGMNYRLNPITGGTPITDGTLTYAVGDPNVLAAPRIGAVAYTNSFPLLTGTTIYYYDESLNTLATSSNPNAGTLNTVGSSGITVNASARTTDMDIAFNPSTRTNTAYFVANTTGNTNDNLYTVNLSTGATTVVGAIGLAVKDIAVQPATFSAAPVGSRIIYALAGTRTLVSFAAASPRQIRSSVNLIGVDSMYSIVGMDVRPATGELMALGYAGGDTSRRYRLYTINTTTGAATAINTGMMDTLALGNTREIGFDFNPTVDRIRVVSGLNGANYRLNPVTGAVAAMDTMLSWNFGDPNANRAVRVSTVAYTNSFPNPGSTIMGGINDSGSVFVVAPMPNSGRLTTVASSIYGASVTPASPGDLDIYYDSASASNIGYLSVTPAGFTQDVLYSMSATTGALTLIDTIGYGFTVSDIAVMNTFRNAPTSVTAVSLASGLAVYPNPAGAVLNLVMAVPAASRKQWTVTDIAGRTMLQGALATGDKQTEISVGNLATGVYLLSVEGQSPLRFSKL